MNMMSLNHVPPTGVSIDDATLALMLDSRVLGHSDGVFITTPAESCLLLDMASNVDDVPLLVRNPRCRHVLMAVGVSTCTGHQQVSADGLSTNGDHFVALHVNITTHVVTLFDSAPTQVVTSYINGALPVLSSNIFGHAGVRLRLIQPAVPLQCPGSNDCAIHTWRNIAATASTLHEVPAYNGVNPDVEDICRDTFRVLFHLFNN